MVIVLKTSVQRSLILVVGLSIHWSLHCPFTITVSSLLENLVTMLAYTPRHNSYLYIYMLVILSIS